MKLLLTSAGITNKSISLALEKLLSGKEKPRIGFIPTAANVEGGEKDWFFDQIKNLQRFGFTRLDMVDISAAAVDWERRLEESDVIFISGGNTFHLLDQTRKTGFDRWIKSNLKDKVYVGVSAGSILATPNINVCTVPPSDTNLPNLTNLDALGFVGFEIEPHCDDIRFETMKRYANDLGSRLYAIDDQTAVLMDGNKVEIVSEGKWEQFNF